MQPPCRTDVQHPQLRLLIKKYIWSLFPKSYIPLRERGVGNQLNDVLGDPTGDGLKWTLGAFVRLLVGIIWYTCHFGNQNRPHDKWTKEKNNSELNLNLRNPIVLVSVLAPISRADYL